jgi:gliding motility-associated lipoprotein GldH
MTRPLDRMTLHASTTYKVSTNLSAVMRTSYLKTVLPVFITLFIVLASCDSKRFYEENKSIPGGIWKSNNRISFDVTISDTLTPYNLYINLRNDLDYSYSNLFLFMKTTFPGGQFAMDTIECTLAEPDGKWTGSGMGRVRFNRFLFQQGVRFRHAGSYAFTFEQAMRVNELRGISDIGIRIEKE